MVLYLKILNERKKFLVAENLNKWSTLLLRFLRQENFEERLPWFQEGLFELDLLFNWFQRRSSREKWLWDRLHWDLQYHRWRWRNFGQQIMKSLMGLSLRFRMAVWGIYHELSCLGFPFLLPLLCRDRIYHARFASQDI